MMRGLLRAVWVCALWCMSMWCMWVCDACKKRATFFVFDDDLPLEGDCDMCCFCLCISVLECVGAWVRGMRFLCSAAASHGFSAIRRPFGHSYSPLRRTKWRSIGDHSLLAVRLGQGNLAGKRVACRPLLLPW